MLDYRARACGRGGAQLLLARCSPCLLELLEEMLVKLMLLSIVERRSRAQPGCARTVETRGEAWWGAGRTRLLVAAPESVSTSTGRQTDVRIGLSLSEGDSEIEHRGFRQGLLYAMPSCKKRTATH